MEKDDNEFEAGRGIYSLERTGFRERLWDSWTDMRAATRRLLREQPSEARLLLYVLASDMVFFISWSLKIMVVPASWVSGFVSTDKIGMFLIAALMLRTVALYFFSFMLHLGSVAFGGTGKWKSTRTGVFWGAFVAAPLGLLAAVVSVMIATLEPRYPALQSELLTVSEYWLGLVPFIWLVSAGAAEANGFARTSPLFLILSAIALLITFAILYFGHGGLAG